MALPVNELFRRLLEDKENSAFSVTKKQEKFVLVQFWQRSESDFGKKGVFLLEIVNNPKGFKDRIFCVNGEEFEVFKVTVALMGKGKYAKITESLVDTSINLKKKSFDLNDPEECTRKLVFQKVEKVLNEKVGRVKVWKCSKTIGKEFFISYCKEMQSWILFAGKKCVLFTSGDFSGYFGKNPVVFSKLKKLIDEKFGDDFASALSGLSLHGIIPFTQEPIKFFGLISLTHPYTYLDCEASHHFFETFALDSAETTVLGDFHDQNQLFPSLLLEFSQHPERVLSDTYFFSEQSPQIESPSVISCCKIPKKLNQVHKFLFPKLKYLNSNKKPFELKTIEEIANKYEVPCETVHHIYTCFKDTHPDLLTQESQEKLIPEHLLNTLPILLVPGYTFKDSSLLAEFLGFKLRKLKRGEALEPSTIYEVEDIPEKLFLEQQCLALFIQWDNESKSRFLKAVKCMQKHELPQSLMKYSKKSGEDALPGIAKLYQEMSKKIKHFQQVLPSHVLELTSQYPTEDFLEVYNKLKTLPAFCLPAKPEQLPEEPKKVEEIVPICFIVIPMGIPGMGKTHAVPVVRKTVVQAGFEFYFLSSDEIKSKAIVDYRKKNLGVDREKAFIKSSKASNNFYYKELLDKIKANNGKLLVYLDKNHPPQAFEALFKRLKAEPINNTLVKLIALVPQCKAPISVPHKHYEFSLDFLVTCLNRAMKRENHLTLVGSPAKIASVVFGIFSLYKNHSFVSWLDEGKIQFLIQVPFTSEGEIQISDELKSRILEKIKNLKTNIEEADEDLAGITEEIMKLDLPPCDNSEVIEREILRILNSPYIEKTEKNVQVEETKNKRKQGKDHKETEKKIKTESKLPVYIGICAEDAVRDAAVDILLSALGRLHEFYHEKSIQRDIEQISALKEKNASKWKPPNSYHITALFIGGSHDKCSSDIYNSFVPGIDTQIAITHIVYSPGAIACAKAEVISPQVSIENKHPHITLLLGSRTAKHSNVILQHVNFEEEFSRSSFKEQKNEQIVFSFKLPEPLNIVGRTKSFF